MSELRATESEMGYAGTDASLKAVLDCVALPVWVNADEAWVRIDIDDDRLIVDVGDDGIGGATATADGSGLAGLADRIAALDGELTITSPRGKGTTLHAEIPLS